MEEAVLKRRWLDINGLPVILLVVATLALVLGVAAWATLRVNRSAAEAPPGRAAPRVAPAPTSVVQPPVNLFRPLAPDDALRINAETPFSTLPLPRIRPVVLGSVAIADWSNAAQCLTMAIYYEAGFEPIQGRRAVAQVILNRMRHSAFPKTVCGVVFQGSELPTGCQFTFTCDGALARVREPKAWATAEAVAKAALGGYTEHSVGTATHYHTDYVVPYWASSLVKLTKVGTHIFYRWPGGTGLSTAFGRAYRGGEAIPSEGQAALGQSELAELAAPFTLSALDAALLAEAEDPLGVTIDSLVAAEPLRLPTPEPARVTDAPQPPPVQSAPVPATPAPAAPPPRDPDTVPAILTPPPFLPLN